MRDDDEQLKIELLSQWKLEAESRNIIFGDIFHKMTKKIAKNMKGWSDNLEILCA